MNQAAIQELSDKELVLGFGNACGNHDRTHLAYMGKAMPDAVYAAFAECRDETIPAMRKELLARLAARQPEKDIRRMLCAAHAPKAYMDDGEATDNSGIHAIDYLRDSAQEIQKKRLANMNRSWALAKGVVPFVGGHVSPPDCGEAGHDDGCCGNTDCLPSRAAATPEGVKFVARYGQEAAGGSTQYLGRLSFDEFRAKNVARNHRWDPEGMWLASNWVVALVGELGELASLLKMRERERCGMPGNKFSPTDRMIADELADVFTYLDLLAACLGVDLGFAAARKFNEVSDRVGFPERFGWVVEPGAAA